MAQRLNQLDLGSIDVREFCLHPNAAGGNRFVASEQQVKAFYPRALGEELKRLVHIVSDEGDLVVAAQRFPVASIILRLPAALILRFGLAPSSVVGRPERALIAAHRFGCASAIRLRAAELIFGPGRVDSGA
jgi:hypothetical protein